MIADAVNLLCTLTSLVCTILLARGYARSRLPLLFWSAICFGCFTLNNVLLLIDIDTYVFPNVTNLASIRAIPSAIGVIALCYALIREAVR
jgi:Family of unknown function (DUF5985)